MSDEEEKKDINGDVDDDHISDIQDTDDEDAKTESESDEIYKYKIQVKKDVDVEMVKAETVEHENKEKDEMTDAAKADAEKTAEEKGDAELDGNAMTSNYQVKESTEFPLPYSSLFVSSGFALSPPDVTATILIVQQTTTPIPTPPITTEAPTITTTVLESDALTVVQLSVAKLEKDVFELKKINHSAEAFASLKSQVPMRHTADLIQKYSVKPTPEPRKIQKPTIDLVPESEKSASKICRIKKEQAEKQKMPKNPANHSLYHDLMEALIEYKNAMDKGVADTVKNHQRQNDDDKDDDKDPSTGTN
ncbi:hypothetical protein Tco_1545958 [Tanacetum coccineum]